MLCLLPGPQACRFLPFRFILLHFFSKNLCKQSATCLELWKNFDLWLDELCCVSPWYNGNGDWALKPITYLLHMQTPSSKQLHVELESQSPRYWLVTFFFSFGWVYVCVCVGGGLFRCGTQSLLFVCKVVSDFCKLYGRNQDCFCVCVRACVCVCLSIASHISKTSEAIAITFDTVSCLLFSHDNASRIILFYLEWSNSAICKNTPIKHSCQRMSISISPGPAKTCWPIWAKMHQFFQKGMWLSGNCVYISRKRPVIPVHSIV